jgi:hypothetical protein
VREDADDHQQFLCRVALHEREECSVEDIRAFDLVRVLAEEEDTLIDQLADNETQDLAQISTRDQFLFFCVTWSEDGHGDIVDVEQYLKRLFAGLIRGFIYYLIVLCPRKVFVFERIEGAL